MLKRPVKHAWAFFLILVLITGAALGISKSFMLLAQVDKGVQFFQDNIKKVVFENGEIKNMPLTRKELHFDEWTIIVDSSFTSEAFAAQTLTVDDTTVIGTPALCVGPKQAYLFSGGTERTIDYPITYSKVIDTEYLKETVSSLRYLVFIVVIIGAFIYKFIIGMLYVLLVITPIVIFKFRRIGIRFGDGLQAALYLVSIQLLVSTILMLLQINLPWSFLIFILFYIFYIGALVNIDLSYSKRNPATSEKPS